MQLEDGAVRFLVAMSSLTYLRIVMVSGMWFISQPAVSSQVLSPWLVSVLSFVLKLFLRSPVLPSCLLLLTRVTESPREALTRWAGVGSRLRSARWWGSYFRMWIFLGHFFLA